MSHSPFLDDNEWDIEQAIESIKRRKRCYSNNDNSGSESEPTEVSSGVSGYVETEIYDETSECNQSQPYTESQNDLLIITPKVTDHHYVPILRQYYPQLKEYSPNKSLSSGDTTTLHNVTSKDRSCQQKQQQKPDQKKQSTQEIHPSTSQLTPTPSNIMGAKPIFHIGRAYDSYTELCKAIEIYEKQNKINLSKRDSKTLRRSKLYAAVKAKPELIYSVIWYQCIHGGSYIRKSMINSESNNVAELNIGNVKKRSNTSTYKLECPFKLLLNLSKDGQTLIVKRLEEEHNHSCNSLIYDQLPMRRRLDIETLEETKMLLALDVNKKKVQQHLYSKGKVVSMKFLHNLKNNTKNMQPDLDFEIDSMIHLEHLLGCEVKKSNSFEDVLVLMMNYHDLSFEMLIGKDGVCQGIYLQTKSMKRKFDTYNEILFIDTSYKLIELGMQIYMILCLDDNGKSEVIAVALAQYETLKTLSWIAESFSKYNTNSMKVKWVMADEDMSGRLVLLNHFPNAQLSICQSFHILCKLKREVTTEKFDISSEERNFSIEIIQSILFAEDRKTCDSNISLLKEKTPKKVVDYFIKIWEPILNQGQVNFYKLSNNILEIFNGKLDLLIKTFSSLTQFFTNLMTVIMNYECEHDHLAFKSLLQRPTVTVFDMVKRKYEKVY